MILILQQQFEQIVRWVEQSAGLSTVAAQLVAGIYVSPLVLIAVMGLLLLASLALGLAMMPFSLTIRGIVRWHRKRATVKA